MVTSGLMIVSQLVRMSRENYRPLGEANVYGIVRRLLGHRDAQVRARACNLVGNMCRWVGTCGRLPGAWCAATAGQHPCWAACRPFQLPCVRGPLSESSVCLAWQYTTASAHHKFAAVHLSLSQDCGAAGTC